MKNAEVVFATSAFFTKKRGVSEELLCRLFQSIMWL